VVAAQNLFVSNKKELHHFTRDHRSTKNNSTSIVHPKDPLLPYIPP